MRSIAHVRHAYMALTFIMAFVAWPSFAAAQDVCWRQSNGRGVGTIPNKCGNGKVYDAGLCYDKCPSGYRDGGPMCWQSCPAGKTEIGPVCSKKIFEGCSNGMVNLGLTCGRKAVGRGVGTIPNKCGPGEEYDAGLCYKKCTGGRTGVGPVCWQNSCPADLPVSCGMGCAATRADCMRSIFKQTNSTLAVVNNVIGAGKIVRTAKTTAKYMGKEAAKKYIKDELKKKARSEGYKMGAAILEETSTYILGELDDGTGEFDVGNLDPTGIVDVVRAFNKPICGAPSPKATGQTLESLTRSARQALIDGNTTKPITGKPVFVSTDNAPDLCLSVTKDGKKATMARCSSKSMLKFQRVSKYKDQAVYQLRNPDTNRCMFSNKEKGVAFAGCNAKYNDQLWYTVRTPKDGNFLLLNANQNKCLFLNKKKFGTYTCNLSFNDQYWRTKESPNLPEKEPLHVFTQANRECFGAKASSTKPGACTPTSTHTVIKLGYIGKKGGPDVFQIRQDSSNKCMYSKRGKVNYTSCSSKDTYWHTLPTKDGVNARVLHIATGTCLFANSSTKFGTSACSTSYLSQKIVFKKLPKVSKQPSKTPQVKKPGAHVWKPDTAPIDQYAFRRVEAAAYSHKEHATYTFLEQGFFSGPMGPNGSRIMLDMSAWPGYSKLKWNGSPDAVAYVEETDQWLFFKNLKNGAHIAMSKPGSRTLEAKGRIQNIHGFRYDAGTSSRAASITFSGKRDVRSTFNRIDAAVSKTTGTSTVLYLFFGNHYVAYTMTDSKKTRKTYGQKTLFSKWGNNYAFGSGTNYPAPRAVTYDTSKRSYLFFSDEDYQERPLGKKTFGKRAKISRAFPQGRAALTGQRRWLHPNEQTRLSTKRTRQCLSDSKGRAKAGSCNTMIEVQNISKSGSTFTVRLKNTATNTCLAIKASDPNGAPYWMRCGEGKPYQWYVTLDAKQGGVQLKSALTNKCLFMNDKKTNTYTCNTTKYNDQVWQSMQ